MEKHKKDSQGRLIDSVSSYKMSDIDREIYATASASLSALQTPHFLRKDHPNDQIFVANFDGTGNDATTDPEHRTNVALISKLIHSSSQDSRIQSQYVKGPGTQSNFIHRTWDGIRGGSFDDRLERMYYELCVAAQKWKLENPDAEIHLISTGFSRGAEQAAAFSRMVHERGIQNITGRHVEHHLVGPDTVTYTKPPLVPPGQVIQSVALFDPVGTGHPHTHDRTLPPSVVSGFQITARDERRNAFPSSQIIPPGLSPDGRFLNVTVPGAHSDIGGSYHVDGLAILNGNLMTDFINAHSDVPLLERRPEPDDPSRYVIHRSEEHLFIYGTSTFERDGMRDVVGSQISPPHCRLVEVCAPPEPLDPALLPLIGERHPVQVHAPVIPEMPTLAMQAPSMEQQPLTSDLTAEQVHAVLHERAIGDAHRVNLTPGNEHDVASPASGAVDLPSLSSPLPPLEISSSLEQEAAVSTRDPRHPEHADSKMFDAISIHLGEIHAHAGIDLTREQMDNLSAAVLVAAKKSGLENVTDAMLGRNDDGQLNGTVHVFDAFHGDIRDPRTGWAGLDASKAINIPVEVSVDRLEGVNQGIEQQQQAMAVERAQQQGLGTSMGL